MPHWCILPWRHEHCCMQDHITNSGFKQPLVISHRITCTFLKSTTVSNFLSTLNTCKADGAVATQHAIPLSEFFDEQGLGWNKKQGNMVSTVKHWAVFRSFWISSAQSVLPEVLRVLVIYLLALFGYNGVHVLEFLSGGYAIHRGVFSKQIKGLAFHWWIPHLVFYCEFPPWHGGSACISISFSNSFLEFRNANWSHVRAQTKSVSRGGGRIDLT